MNEKPERSFSNIVKFPTTRVLARVQKADVKVLDDALTRMELLQRLELSRSLTTHTYLRPGQSIYTEGELLQTLLPCGLSVGIKLTAELSFQRTTTEESHDF